MRRSLWFPRVSSSLVVLAFAAPFACGGPEEPARSPTAGASASVSASVSAAPIASTSASAVASTSPLLQPWSGEHGGVPPFASVTVADLEAAMSAAIAETAANVERIAEDPAAPTFDNTLLALERAEDTLRRVETIYGVYTSTLKDDAVAAMERRIEPKLAALNDAQLTNGKLYAKVSVIYDAREKSGLSKEQQRLAWLVYTNMTRSGAKLDAAGKKRLADIHQELAKLSTTFAQNLLAEESGRSVVLETEADLAGLPASVKAAASRAASEHGLAGKWLVLNTRSSVDPFLTYASRRDLREKVWKMFVSRGDGGDAHDNNETITKILALRAERAKLLGYATHAHWQLEQRMAKTPERAMELMMAVWKPAVARVREEVRDMQAIADREGKKIKIEPWDYRYYGEKVRKAKYDLDQNDVKPYLQLEKLREAMFWVAGELLGLTFKEITDGSVPVYHPDVRVFRVTDTTGKHVGLWYFDPFARAGKNSGAWMNSYRSQSRAFGDVPAIVSNNANFVKGKAGEPILISWDDARTLFHEFGHALHGLSSNVTYRSLSGTATARDFVEFPSQLLEHWVSTRAVLDKFALHVETGKPMPDALVAKLEKSRSFHQGFATVEYLSSALVDMKLHLAADKPIDPRAFEVATLKELGMPKELVMRHRTPQFAHIFSGNAYSAGYYSYLWSETLSADAWEAFTEAAGGAYDKGVAKRLYEHVLSVGNTIDPADTYRAFRGRDPGVAALLRDRGFAVPAKGKPAGKP